MALAPLVDGDPFWDWPDRADGGLGRAPHATSNGQ